MKQSDDKPSFIAAAFQVLMLLLSIWLFWIGLDLVQSVGTMPQSTKIQPMDSSITRSVENESSSVSIKTTNETKKEYTVKDSEGEKCLPCIKDAYDAAYNYFILSAGVLAIAFFLPKIQSFTFKDVSVTVKEAVEKLEEEKERLVDVVNSSQEASIGEGGKQKGTEKIKPSKRKPITKNIIDEDDYQKGQWGGLSEVKDRALKAFVSSIKNSDFFNVALTVESTNPKNPLNGKVKFHLHDTFANPNPVIAVQNGVAKLEVVAWGAFTVGAETDDSKITLELDLASDEVKAPKEFKEG